MASQGYEKAAKMIVAGLVPNIARQSHNGKITRNLERWVIEILEEEIRRDDVPKRWTGSEWA